MSSFRKILALVLAALWLPTVQHCMLEAAGILAGHEGASEHAQCCETPAGSCDADACQVLEGGNYRPSSASIEVVAPSLTTCVCLLCEHVADVLAEAPSVALVPLPCFERPRDASPTWQFVQRAALPPRAPSLSLA